MDIPNPIPVYTTRDKEYLDGYHWGIKGKDLRLIYTIYTKKPDWREGYDDGHADYLRIRDEGSLEEQLQASLT